MDKLLKAQPIPLQAGSINLSLVSLFIMFYPLYVQIPAVHSSYIEDSDVEVIEIIPSYPSEASPKVCRTSRKRRPRARYSPSPCGVKSPQKSPLAQKTEE